MQGKNPHLRKIWEDSKLNLTKNCEKQIIYLKKEVASMKPLLFA